MAGYVRWSLLCWLQPITHYKLSFHTRASTELVSNMRSVGNAKPSDGGVESVMKLSEGTQITKKCEPWGSWEIEKM